MPTPPSGELPVRARHHSGRSFRNDQPRPQKLRYLPRRPPRRLVAMTDETRELLAACGIAPEDSDGQAEVEQNDGEGTTYDEEPGENTSVQERDA